MPPLFLVPDVVVSKGDKDVVNAEVGGCLTKFNAQTSAINIQGTPDLSPSSHEQPFFFFKH